MASSEDEDRRRAEKARQVGLFRYALIQDLLDPVMTTRERGRLARELAEKEHTDPFGRQVKVSRGTIDRWTRDYRGGGFAALVPEPRKAVPRTPAEVLELAAALKRENPAGRPRRCSGSCGPRWAGRRPTARCSGTSPAPG